MSTLLNLSVFADSYNDLFTNQQPVTKKDYKQKFWDVDKTHWAFNAIAELSDRGAINGYADGSFKPENTVTRAEWAKIMIQTAGLSANDTSVKFADMSGHWALAYVNAASDFLTAFDDNKYRPDQAVTREDVTMAMVKLKGYDLNEVDYSVLSKFADIASILNYIKVYVAIAVEKGLIAGFEDGTFRGQATLTRAEAATLLWRAFQFGNNNKITASSVIVDNNIDNSSINSAENASVNFSQSNTAIDNTTITQSNTAAENTPITQSSIESSPSNNNFDGYYSDILSQRAGMEIKKKNDIYKIKIGWSSSARETTEWYFDAKIEKTTGTLVYQNGYEFLRIFNDDGTVTYDLVNENCEGNFVFKNNLLIWNDYSEDISEKCKFEKYIASYEEDYSQHYNTATLELQKYASTCMNSEIYESAVEKEKRLSKQYNLARGLLLSCFGYKDSDELLEKLDSIHNIALKLPEAIQLFTRNDIISFEAIASLRDTQLFVETTEDFSDLELSLKFAYDYSKFNAEIKNVFSIAFEKEYVQFIVSLFAENYKDAEFARLLDEAYNAAGGDNTAEFQMTYGGYTLTITVKPAGYYNVDIFITGKK